MACVYAAIFFTVVRPWTDDAFTIAIYVLDKKCYACVCACVCVCDCMFVQPKLSSSFLLLVYVCIYIYIYGVCLRV